jgi:chromosome segregation ATPase
LENLTAAQIDELAARIETTRANRPPSLTQQIAELQAALSTTHEQKEAKVEARKEARSEADVLEAKIAEIHDTLRRTEFVEAAAAAGFKQPQVVADLLVKTAGKDIAVTAAVTELASTGAFAMATPARSAEIGGSLSQSAPTMDPGRLALMNEIKAAQGR